MVGGISLIWAIPSKGRGESTSWEMSSAITHWRLKYTGGWCLERAPADAVRKRLVLTAGRNGDLSGVYFCTHLAAGRS